MCERLSRVERIGLDIETTIYERPTRLCTIQLATTEQNWVIDALTVGDLAPATALFGETRVLKIIHNAGFERGVLAEYGIDILNVFDTLTASSHQRRNEPGGHSLRVVCQREFGLNLDKAMQKCDWTQRPLSQRHIDYAALDAEVLIDLHERLR